ncbi:MAG: hypothetical protein M1818_004359 [Claussenomyces sp. TS43310]|nr:MAG: hypothetical protein M1818_004359 [Claussenomyces sp. TS43310]
MPRHPDAPQISITNWLLGGPLVSTPSRRRRTQNQGTIILTRPSRAKEAKEEKKEEKKEEHKGDDGNKDPKAAQAEIPTQQEQVKFNLSYNESHISSRLQKEREMKMKECLAHFYLQKPTEPAPAEQPTQAPEPAKGREAAAAAAAPIPAPNSASIPATSTTAPKADNSPKASDSAHNWTQEQDEQILRLKAAGRTWKDIAAAVTSSKSSVSARWRALRPKDDDGGDDAGCAAAAKEEDAGKDGKTGDGAVEPDVEGKWEEARIGAPAAPAPAPAPRPRLQPDDIWDRGDCELLEILEARYRDQKWLQIQAGFYNLTGRMVAADIIKLKFGV